MTLDQYIAATVEDIFTVLRLELSPELLAALAKRNSLPALAALELIAAGIWPADELRREMAAANLAVVRKLRAGAERGA